MPWHVEGTYFENCNCDMVCPCSTSGLTAPADNERCNVALAFHVETGEVNGVDVGGHHAVTRAVLRRDCSYMRNGITYSV